MHTIITSKNTTSNITHLVGVKQVNSAHTFPSEVSTTMAAEMHMLFSNWFIAYIFANMLISGGVLLLVGK